MSLPLSPDERRIVNFLNMLADRYEVAALDNPFTFNRVRAKVVRRIAVAISEGKHR